MPIGPANSAATNWPATLFIPMSDMIAAWVRPGRAAPDAAFVFLGSDWMGPNSNQYGVKLREMNQSVAKAARSRTIRSVSAKNGVSGRAISRTGDHKLPSNTNLRIVD